VSSVPPTDHRGRRQTSLPDNVRLELELLEERRFGSGVVFLRYHFNEFIDLFDKVFVLDVDVDTLNERLDNRPDDDWGKSKSERELILRLHATKEDIPSSGIVIDATQPLVNVVDEILSHVRA
jgi:thymidylate kinase